MLSITRFPLHQNKELQLYCVCLLEDVELSVIQIDGDSWAYFSLKLLEYAPSNAAL